MILCLGSMGLAFHLHVQGPMIIVLTFLMIVPLTMGLSPLPWLMIPELFPTQVRARAVSVCITVQWLAGFTGTLTFPILFSKSTAVLGSPAGIFWLYALICVAALLFGWKLLPETKGKTLEEVALSWQNR
jgi:SP family arabinose:H+ symporter-like MFS transporter